jgi:hypothetical protein
MPSCFKAVSETPKPLFQVLSFSGQNFPHRDRKKRDFRRLWITRRKVVIRERAASRSIPWRSVPEHTNESFSETKKLHPSTTHPPRSFPFPFWFGFSSFSRI